MIRFIQKYQKFFYIVITTVIVVSFSFFGTYGSMQGSSMHEQVAFTPIDGQAVTRGELEQMAYFLSTDSYDKLQYGPVFGPNFMNDGVIKKDFLETGLAIPLMQNYMPQLQSDLESRFQKEKNYHLYVHPDAPFISQEGAYTYFAPQIKPGLDYLKASVNFRDESVLKAKIDLYLAEKRLPLYAVNQILLYQEKQYPFVPRDPFLTQVDLSLFGYHNLDDWFGPKFTRLVAEFIYNAAALAEKKGYKVTKEEAYSELLRNSDKSFQEVNSKAQVPFKSRTEYMNEQLRRMGLNTPKAIKIWEKVLLFRRLFYDIVNAQPVSMETVRPFQEFTETVIAGDLYRLPEPLRFNELKDLALFETYLAETSTKKAEDLKLPSIPKSIDQIKKSAPELLQKQYLVEIKKASLKDLEAKVSIKETLAWELDPKNYEAMQKEFADLGIKESDTVEKRIEALDGLDDRMRLKVDRYARGKILELHPEALESALDQSPWNKQVLNVSLKGGMDPLPGVKDREDFIRALDSNKELPAYTQDKEHIYAIKVLDRSPDYEILTFEEAGKILPDLMQKRLEPFYIKARSENEEKFKSEKGYKPYSEVENEIMSLYYAPLLGKLKKEANANLKDKSWNDAIPDTLASIRFIPTIEEIKKGKIQENPAIETSSEKLPARSPYAAQFEWKKENREITRSTRDLIFDKEILFSLKPGEWSSILTPPNGDLSLFKLDTIGVRPNLGAEIEQVNQIRNALGDEAMKGYFIKVLEEIKAGNGISLDFYDQAEPEIEEREPIPATSDV